MTPSGFNLRTAPVRSLSQVETPSAFGLLAAIAGLIVLRAVMAGLLPLSADEAYYWLWSRHLAAGYFDHPPAIAFLIRAGTLVFGDNALGVRASGIVLSLPATWFVWQSARLILGDAARARLAALLFNLMLMTAVELLAATPDMPSIVTSAGFLFCLAKLEAGGNPRWWLAAGAGAGLSLLSKYSALFLGAGALFWLIADPRQRRWLATPWPYLGALLAGLIFLPNLWWQAQHGWMTFAFQFARVTDGHLTGRFLLEFLGAQFGLATPFVFLLAILGLGQALRRPGEAQFLPAALLTPALLYFLIHALHDRVQGNWPCFLYCAVAILAAAAVRDGGGWRAWCSRAAVPVAALLLLATYIQALYGVLPLKADPVARLLGRGFAAMTQAVARNGTVLTTDYETTAWLRFYRPDLTVIQINQPYRYLTAPAPGRLAPPLFYLAEDKRDESALLRHYFGLVGPAMPLQTSRRGLPITRYALYPLAQPKAAIPGRMP